MVASSSTLRHPLARVQPRPRSVVEGLSRGGDRGVDIFGTRHLDMADRLFGMWGDDRRVAGGWRVCATVLR